MNRGIDQFDISTKEKVMMRR